MTASYKQMLFAIYISYIMDAAERELIILNAVQMQFCNAILTKIDYYSCKESWGRDTQPFYLLILKDWIEQLTFYQKKQFLQSETFKWILRILYLVNLIYLLKSFYTIYEIYIKSRLRQRGNTSDSRLRTIEEISFCVYTLFNLLNSMLNLTLWIFNYKVKKGLAYNLRKTQIIA